MGRRLWQHPQFHVRPERAAGLPKALARGVLQLCPRRASARHRRCANKYATSTPGTGGSRLRLIAAFSFSGRLAPPVHFPSAMATPPSLVLGISLFRPGGQIAPDKDVVKHHAKCVLGHCRSLSLDVHGCRDSVCPTCVWTAVISSASNGGRSSGFNLRIKALAISSEAVESEQQLQQVRWEGATEEWPEGPADERA